VYNHYKVSKYDAKIDFIRIRIIKTRLVTIKFNLLNLTLKYANLQALQPNHYPKCLIMVTL